ncbi:hypothetical protein [Pontibacter rugosus]|uniref:YD repeat-containing protein n=1 Tax=Pontibacter rugosus TaxID=1745966 RepID=A0ABW3SKW8_9BACT
MRKQLLYLLPMALLLWGCPGESDDAPKPEEECLLQSESVTSVGGGADYPIWTSRYTYNSQKQLTAVARDSSGVPVSQSTLSYDSNNRLVQVKTANAELVYEYNSKNQLVKQTRNRQSGTAQNQDYYAFTYNSNNELAEARYYYVVSGSPSFYYIWKYTYTKGNPTRVEQLNTRDERIALLELSYDEKPSAKPALADTFFEPTSAPAANNPIAGTLNAPGFGTQKYTIAYTYNQKGLPLTATQTYVNGSINQVTTYTYTCP